MAAAGIDPKAIDIVILSHLHPDHINGLKTADGGLAFPNAETKVSARCPAGGLSSSAGDVPQARPACKQLRAFR
jgi:metal-dependent hydrolase (beta-lactamase superfamily II)